MDVSSVFCAQYIRISAQTRGAPLKKHVKDKVNLKKHVKTTTAVYFSVQDKVHLKKHVKTTAVYFSVQQ